MAGHAVLRCAFLLVFLGSSASAFEWLDRLRAKGGDLAASTRQCVSNTVQSARQKWEEQERQCEGCGATIHCRARCTGCAARSVCAKIEALPNRIDKRGRRTLYAAFAQSGLMQYGNWGGPDWSGGQRPFKNGGEAGQAQPVDSLDDACRTHDLAYDQAEDAGSIAERRQAMREADAAFLARLQELKQQGPENWAQPAADPEKARKFLDRAVVVFTPSGWRQTQWWRMTVHAALR